jgi:hypothetical protein
VNGSGRESAVECGFRRFAVVFATGLEMSFSMRRRHRGAPVPAE